MNAQDAWSATLGQLQVQLNRATYNTWLGHARYVAYEAGRLVISVPNAYAKDWLEKHLAAALAQTFGKLLDVEAQVEVIVWDPTEEADDVRSIFGIPEDAPDTLDCLVDARKTLDNFTLIDSNRDTVLFMRFVLESPFGAHPSLFIAGGPGTGKSHLLHAAANALLGRQLRVVYVNGEQFTSEMVSAIRSGETAAFREKYRGCDVLIMDQVEFLEGKDASQEELRHIWEALSRRKRLMIFASRRLPRDLHINRDLRSCFNRWLLCEMGPLDPAACAAIIVAKAGEMNIPLPLNVRQALVERIGGDPSMIEGALTQITSYAQITRAAVSETMVDALFKNREVTLAARSLDVTDVISATAAHFKLTNADLIGKRRTQAVSAARQLAMHLARSLTDASLAQIGLAFGGRDHTTVLHGCTRTVEALRTDDALRQSESAIRSKLLPGYVPPRAVEIPVNTLEFAVQEE